ncbi:MAG: hypothetical protein ACPG8W_00525 [Candidatus Promineifilaceae bacterium]
MTTYLLLFLALFLAACGSSESAVEESVTVSAEKPQLIEFYTDW